MARNNTIKDRRKQQLINATMESIAKRGLTETTITHISRGASMSRGIINFYFTSKEMMMREVLGYLIDEYDNTWMSAVTKAEDAQSRLEALVQAHFDRKVCSSKRLNVMSAFWGHAASHEAYREKIDASDTKLQEQIAGLWKEIQPKGYDGKQFAKQLHALIRGLWLSFLMAPKTTEREELAGQCLAFIKQHLQPIRVVTENTSLPVRPMVVRPVGSKPKKMKKSRAEDGQMDIEDLFAS